MLERTIRGLVESNVKKSKGYLKVCPSIVHFSFYSDWICCHGPQVENIHLLLHSRNEARKARKLGIQLQFIIILPFPPFHKFAPVSLQKLCFSIVYSGHYQI